MYVFTGHLLQYLNGIKIKRGMYVERECREFERGKSIVMVIMKEKPKRYNHNTLKQALLTHYNFSQN